jgi:hypothetical protein
MPVARIGRKIFMSSKDAFNISLSKTDWTNTSTLSPVHSNTADPQLGRAFSGGYNRRASLSLDINF